MKRFVSVILVFFALFSVYVSAADLEKVTPGGLVKMTSTAMPKVSKALERAAVLKIARSVTRQANNLKFAYEAEVKLAHLDYWLNGFKPYVKKTAVVVFKPIIIALTHIRGFGLGAFTAAENVCIRCALGNNNVMGLIKQKIGASIEEMFRPLLVLSEDDYFMLGLFGFDIPWVITHKMIRSMKTATLEVLLEHYPEYTDEIRQIIGSVAETVTDSNYDGLVVLANTFFLEVESSTRQEARLKAVKAFVEFKKSKSVSQEVTEVNG